jgi:hypothetical protein
VAQGVEVQAPVPQRKKKRDSRDRGWKRGRKKAGNREGASVKEETEGIGGIAQA